MAAPAPATPQIAILAAAAATAALHFDIAHANNTQSTPGGPPNLPATTPHNAPPAVPTPGLGGLIPIAMYPVCNDRAHHQNPPGTHPCLSQFNTRPAVGPGAILPFPVHNVGPHVKTCATVGPLHPAGFMVCLHCLRDIRFQAWCAAILADVETPPPALGLGLPALVPAAQPMTPAAAAAAGAALWTTFMTHLCLSCEREEMLLLRERSLTPGGPGLTLPTRRTGRMPWPYTTCTCLRVWHEHTDPAFPLFEVCIRHRHRASCEKHDELLIIRNQNDKWLRETAKDRNNPGRIIRLRHNNIGHWNIMNGRRSRGSFRACRCGAEPRTGMPRVWMCLGCEGVIHNIIPPPPPPPPPPGVPPPPPPLLPVFVLPAGFPTVRTRRAQRTLQGANRFPLRRTRH